MTPLIKYVCSVGLVSLPFALSALEYFSLILVIALCGPLPLLDNWSNSFSASILFSIH
jgi:hypothetical protein